MKLKHRLTCLTAVLMLSSVFTACSNSPDDSSITEVDNSSSEEAEVFQEAPETSPVAANGDPEATAAQEIDFEPAVSAGPGQAYLAVAASNWEVQYWGSAEQNGYMLSYHAGIADIHGDGDYSVSVTADTKGFRYAMTNDPNEKDCLPVGLDFMSIMIPDGEEIFPGAVITINSIRIDGNELELTAKNYTSSDNGKETRTNIYNSYVSKPDVDARTPEGSLYDEDGDALSICRDYSAQIIDTAELTTWTTIQVDFTITGIDGDSADAENPDDAV